MPSYERKGVIAATALLAIGGAAYITERTIRENLKHYRAQALSNVMELLKNPTDPLNGDYEVRVKGMRWTRFEPLSRLILGAPGEMWEDMPFLELPLGFCSARRLRLSEKGISLQIRYEEAKGYDNEEDFYIPRDDRSAISSIWLVASSRRLRELSESRHTI